MTVIDEKPVPLYVKECSECGSTFTYRKVEVSLGSYIYCPVCGISLWADFERIKDEERKETEDAIVRCKDCKYYRYDKEETSCALAVGLIFACDNDFCSRGEMK